MRIIAGKFRGRVLSAPQDKETRPTADRVRENLFNILDSMIIAGHLPPWEDLHIIDGFSGTGALGLEALSRGVQTALFIEKNREAATICRKNINACKLTDTQAQMITADILHLPRIPKTRPQAQLVFLDPPYGLNLGIPALQELSAKDLLTKPHICVLETDKKYPENIPETYQERDTRYYGRTCLQILEISY